MPLIDARGFRITPDVGAGLRSGFGARRDLTRSRLEELILGETQEKIGRQRKVRETLGGLGRGLPKTQQEAQLAAQTADFAPQGDQLDRQLLAERPQIMSQDQLAKEARRIDPVFADQLLTSMGMDEPSKRAEASRFAARVQSLPIEMQNREIIRRAEDLQAQGRPNNDTLELLDMDPRTRQQVFQGVQMAELSAKDRIGAQIDSARIAQKAAEAGGPSQVQSSEILEDGTVQIVRKDGTVEIKQPDEVGRDIVRRAKERGVDLQQRRAQGRRTGTVTADTANDLFEQTTKLRDNNNNLRQVVETVQAGAETGPLISRLPSFRAESVRLDNIRRRLGLDIIGSVTFGALSEGELELALDTALPTGLEGPELVQWAQDKIESQEKLAKYLEDQAIFLSKPGNSQADWVKEQRKAPERAGVEEITTEQLQNMSIEELEALRQRGQ